MPSLAKLGCSVHRTRSGRSVPEAKAERRKRKLSPEGRREGQLLFGALDGDLTQTIRLHRGCATDEESDLKVSRPIPVTLIAVSIEPEMRT